MHWRFRTKEGNNCGTFCNSGKEGTSPIKTIARPPRTAASALRRIEVRADADVELNLKDEFWVAPDKLDSL